MDILGWAFDILCSESGLKDQNRVERQFRYFLVYVLIVMKTFSRKRDGHFNTFNDGLIGSDIFPYWQDRLIYSSRSQSSP